MWALLVCVLVKPVEIANGLDLQHGTSAECLDVATDGKGGRPSTFVVEVKRTSSCPNCGGANHSGEGQNNVLCANGQQGLRNRVIWNSSHPYASQFQRGAPRNMPNSTFFTAAAGQYRECVSKFDRRRHVTPLSPCRSNSPRRIAY